MSTPAEVLRDRWIEEMVSTARPFGRHVEWQVPGFAMWGSSIWSGSPRMKLGVQTNAGRYMKDVRR